MALGPSKTHKSTSKITSINYKLIENGKFYGLDQRMVIANNIYRRDCCCPVSGTNRKY